MRFFDDGRLVLTNNGAERAINPIDPGAATQTVQDALHAPTDVTSLTSRASSIASTPVPVLPGIPSDARLLSTDCS